MRVAAEVRKRMDEAGADLEKHAMQGNYQDEEEEERAAVYGGDAERRSVREGDRELLEGAEAEVEIGGVHTGMESASGSGLVTEGEAEKTVEFER